METNAQRVATPPPRPLMVWDGDCHFCGAWIRRWKSFTGAAVDYETFQSVGARFPELTETDYSKAVHLILPDGRVTRAAEAVFAARAFSPKHTWGLQLYRRVPAFAAITEVLYKIIARNRMLFSWLTRLLWGEPAPSTYRFSGMLFTRMVGLMFLVAFLSFWAQAAGLVGSQGIFPVSAYFPLITNAAVANHVAPFWYAPSLLWLAPSDTGLYTLLGAGTVGALLAMAGLVPAWALLVCVVTYDSLRGGVPVFLNYQWDALLVETGLVALLVAPWGWWQRPWSPREPPRAGRWMVWWLLFKLMFLSGLVKVITNGSPAGPAHPDFFRRFMAAITGVPIGENTWLDGTALKFHYFTQPIPGPTSWWFAHWSDGAQSASLWACMFIEIVVPFAFFGPRRLRHFAALLQIFLQVALMATGNYGFFNLLTIVLCLPLFDDAFWPARVRRMLERKGSGPAAAASADPDPRKILAFGGRVVRGVAATLIFFVGLTELWQAWQGRSGQTREPPPVSPTLFENIEADANIFSTRFQQLGLVNSYGLFRVMTTDRPELIIEGSDDGTTWKPYEFIWKPGDPMRSPEFSTPHMPRLDWQMWFAALDVYYSHHVPEWLPLFLTQIQRGNPYVLGLMAHNPFPNAPPKQLRIRLYLYYFSTPEEHQRTGAWWWHPDQPAMEMMLRAQ